METTMVTPGTYRDRLYPETVFTVENRPYGRVRIFWEDTFEKGKKVLAAGQFILRESEVAELIEKRVLVPVEAT